MRTRGKSQVPAPSWCLGHSWCWKDAGIFHWLHGNIQRQKHIILIPYDPTCPVCSKAERTNDDNELTAHANVQPRLSDCKSWMRKEPPGG